MEPKLMVPGDTIPHRNDNEDQRKELQDDLKAAESHTLWTEGNRDARKHLVKSDLFRSKRWNERFYVYEHEARWWEHCVHIRLFLCEQS